MSTMLKHGILACVRCVDEAIADNSLVLGVYRTTPINIVVFQGESMCVRHYSKMNHGEKKT